jgi:hypothetical protein
MIVKGTVGCYSSVQMPGGGGDDCALVPLEVMVAEYLCGSITDSGLQVDMVDTEDLRVVEVFRMCFDVYSFADIEQMEYRTNAAASLPQIRCITHRGKHFRFLSMTIT